MKTKVYDEKGKEKENIELPKEVFELPWNADLVHQVIVSMESNQRQENAHAKDRSEVSGTGKKPWRQKGTGRARHGSRRSPIWVGGGVAHGPRNDKDYSKKINKKMRTKALFTALSQKARDGELVFVSEIADTPAKTKNAQQMLTELAKVKGFEKISYKNGKRALVYSPGHNENLYKMFRNIPSAHVQEVRNSNPLDVMRYKYIVFINPKESLSALTNKVK